MNCVLVSSRQWNEILADRLTEKTGIKFHLITKKEQLNIEYLESIKPRYIFFPHWSYIIPEEIYTKFECVIFHMTDLPYGRGGSPLQNLILRGHDHTKLTALRCIKELDAGPVYLKKELSLEGTAQEIFYRTTGLIEKMITEIIETEPMPIKQHGEVVLFKKRKPEQSNLKTAELISVNDFYDFIRMLDADGYPRAYADIKGYKVEFSEARFEAGILVGKFKVLSQNHINKS